MVFSRRTLYISPMVSWGLLAIPLLLLLSKIIVFYGKQRIVMMKFIRDEKQAHAENPPAVFSPLEISYVCFFVCNLV